MRQRHRRIAAAKLAAAKLTAAKPRLVLGQLPVHRTRGHKPPNPAKIVEGDLRRGKARKHSRRLGVEIAQQAVTQSFPRHRAQLFLDRLERTPERGPARQRIVQIERPRIQTHRVKAGEPANGPRQIDRRKPRLAAKHFFLAAMAFQIKQNAMALPPSWPHTTASVAAPIMPPAPVGDRHRKPRQQHVVDAAMERRRNTRQQRLPSARQAASASDAPRCLVRSRAGSSEPSTSETTGLLSIPRQNESSPTTRSCPRMRRKPMRPAPERRPPRRKRRRPPRRNRRHAAARSGTRIRHDTPSTAR